MIGIIFLVVIAAIILFGILLRLSTTPRIVNSRAYFLPLICCSVLVTWMTFSFFYWGQDSRSNYHNISQDRFMLVPILVIGVIALVFAGINGTLLSIGSRLWTQKQLLTSKLLFTLSLFLWVTITGSTFFLFGVLSWVPIVSP